VPKNKEDDYIRDYYDRLTLGYPRAARTTEHIRRNFVFPNIRRKVLEYIKRYNSCCKNKVLRYAKYGNLKFRELP